MTPVTTEIPVAHTEVEAGVATEAPAETTAEPEANLIEEELLVEEVSIDGMCGVY